MTTKTLVRRLKTRTSRGPNSRSSKKSKRSTRQSRAQRPHGRRGLKRFPAPSVNNYVSLFPRTATLSTEPVPSYDLNNVLEAVDQFLSDDWKGAGTGIDTVRLLLDAPVISSTTALKCVSPKSLGSNSNRRGWRTGVLWKDENGAVVRGQMARFHEDSLVIHLWPSPCGGAPLCFVTFSVARRSDTVVGRNLGCVSALQLEAQLEVVEERLRELGIETDIYEAKVSRLDIFRDIWVSRSMNDYMPLIATFQPAHCKYRSIYTSGILVGNKQCAWCIYDKSAHLRMQGIESPRSDKTLLRFEFRMRKASAVQRRLKGVKVVRDLLKHFDELEPLLERRLRSDLFRYQPTERDLSARRSIEPERPKRTPQELQMQLICNRYGSQQIARLILVQGVQDTDRLEREHFRAGRAGLSPMEYMVKLLKKNSPKSCASAISKQQSQLRELRYYALSREGHLFCDLSDELSRALGLQPGHDATQDAESIPQVPERKEDGTTPENNRD